VHFACATGKNCAHHARPCATAAAVFYFSGHQALGESSACCNPHAARTQQLRHVDLFHVLMHGQQRRLVHQLGKIRAGKANRLARRAGSRLAERRRRLLHTGLALSGVR
jgi:hypothetical protein